MRCKYDADGQCENGQEPGSLYCARHPLDDLDFFLGVIDWEMRCPRCGRIYLGEASAHRCPPT